MDKQVVDFIQVLRHHGVPVSPAETLDALHAVTAVGVADREQLKQALAITLAKSLKYQGRLNSLFDQFFAIHLDTDVDSVTDKGQAVNQQSELQSVDHADVSYINVSYTKASYTNESDLLFSSEELAQVKSSLGDLLLNADDSEWQRRLLNAADTVGTQDMKVFLQKKIIARRMLMEMGDKALQHELQNFEQAQRNLELVALLKKRRQKLVDRIEDFVDQQFLLYSSRTAARLSDERLQSIKLSHVDGIYLQQLIRLVHKVAKKLASVHSRQRKVTKRGYLDVRKTIAANAAFDGYLVHTRWKSTRIDRPKLMVICDVSGSVSQYAKFLLLFVYALQDVLPRVRSFVFSNRMIDATDLFQKEAPEVAMEIILDRWSGYSTDYGRALQDFQQQALERIDHNTQVIMLGDARNNHDNPQAETWQQVYQRAQRVLWLNPEARSQWNTGDSVMSEYSPYCSMVESCNTLRDMERIFGRLLKHSR